MIVQAADRFHVPPWELLAKGRAWTEIAIATVTAERRAANDVARRQQRQAKMRSAASRQGR